MTTSNNNIQKYFSAGLSRGGRLAAWAVALGAAGVWYYIENRDNGKAFDAIDAKEWNDKKKRTFQEETKK